MELKIKDLKVGDELECISCEAFVNDQVADERVLNLKKIIVSGFFGTYVCVNDSGIANDHKLVIGNFRLKHFRKKPKLQFSDLEVGDYVYVRDDLIEYQGYGCNSYVSEIGNGIQQIKSFHSEYSQFRTNKSDYWVTPEMLDLSRSMKKEDYLKMNEKEGVSFDDLIDVAVQAYKDNLIGNLFISNNYIEFDRGIESFDYGTTCIENGINFIQSLYKETFVIETEEDLKRIKIENETSITLANGEVIPYLINEVYSDHVVFFGVCVDYFVFELFALKGATVTQSK